MAAVVGITGDVVLPSGFNLLVKSGTLTLSMTEVDTTNTSTSNGDWEGVTSLRMGTGTAVGIPKSGSAGTAPGFGTIPTGNNVQVPAAATFKVVGSTCTYSGNILIKNIKVGFNYAGAAALSFDFKFSGPITETWA